MEKEKNVYTGVGFFWKTKFHPPPPPSTGSRKALILREEWQVTF